MASPLRIIDNKRINLTDSEWALFQEICKSYDRPNFQGKDLFKGLFETDDNGIIIFLRPPTSAYTSMEVYMFLITVMIHQHVGTACDGAATLFDDIKTKFNQAAEQINSEMEEFKKVKAEAKELIEELKNSRDGFDEATDKENKKYRQLREEARKEERKQTRKSKE